MKVTPVKMLLLVSMLGLAACNSTDDSGTLTLGVTDAPVDNANRVVVEFTGVTLKPSAGNEIAFDFDEPRQIDLLALQGGETDLLLDEVSLAAGNYNWIRLTVNAGMNASDSFIELEDGSVHALFIPSGNQTGLKLVQGFTVPANGSADFTIDFDLRKSVVDPQSVGTPYILKPALRLLDNTEVGAIAGTVDNAIASAADCSPAVYVYEGSDVTPDDVGSSVEPVASALVNMSDATGEFEYTVAFLLAGDYTAALTCDADADAADTDDDITFEAQQNATVEVNQVTTVDF
jgi:hypothetical protein